MDLVGRDAPLAALRAKLDLALVGRGGVVTITGEPGIGKSTLAEAAASEAATRGAEIVRGRAWELGEAPPYLPLWSCFASLGIGPDARELDAFALWERVLARLGASTKPALWLLEDLHAADLLTLDLLTFLAQPLRSLPVIAIVTCRDADPRLSERVSQRLTRIARDGLEIRLERLAPSDVARVAERCVDRPLSADAVRRLADLTGGNPLFVVECARAFASQGAASSATALPGTVREIILERVALLAPATRDALAAGAILGREFSAQRIARMHEKLPAQVIDALLPALRARIVTEAKPGTFVFSHVFVRDAVEDALSPGERVRLHGLAAQALAREGDAPDVIVARARHGLASMPTGAAADEAVALAEHAASLLERQGAFDRAYAMRKHIEDAGLGASASPDAQLALARLAQAAGQRAEARRICDALLAAPATDATLRARVALVIGADLHAGLIDRRLVALLEQAEAALGDDQVALRCAVRARLAAALQPADDYAVPVAMARRAIADARAIGDEALLVEVLYVAGSALVDCAPVEERLAVTKELLDRATRSGERPIAMRAHLRLAIDQLETGDLAGWKRSVDRIVELGEELGHPRYRWRALFAASMRAIAAGRTDDSERWTVELEQLSALTDDPSLAVSLVAHRAERARLLHKDEEVRSAAAELEAALARVPHGERILDVLAASHAARLEDRARTAELLARLEPFAAFAERDMSFLGLVAEAHAFAGTEAQRRRSRAVLEPLEGRHFHGGLVVFSYVGSVSRVLGLLDASLGERERAVERLRQALQNAVEHHLGPWVAQLRYDLACVLGDSPEGAALRTEAALLAEELGMTGLVARATSRAAASRAGPTSAATPPALATPAAPSPAAIEVTREGEVWRVRAGDRSALVKDGRGMRLLARLMAHPGEEIHVLALASDDGASLAETSAGEHLDARARRAYEERLHDLAERIAEAEKHADAGRLDSLRRERAMLEAELARAFGLGRRERQAGSAGERARVNVQRRIKDTIARISEIDAALGKRLARSVRTGTYCSFWP